MLKAQFGGVLKTGSLGNESSDSLISNASVTSSAVSETETIWGAARVGDAHEVSRFLDDGKRGLLDGRARWDDSTPLMEASSRGHMDVVRLLLLRGAQVDLGDKEGCTALFWAAWMDRTEVVRVLLEHGACFEARDAWGWTPLMAAAHYGNVNVVRSLLQHMATHPLALLGGGGGSFDDAKLPAIESSAKGLVMQKAEEGGGCGMGGEGVDGRDKNGETALFKACAEGWLETARVLLLEGAADWTLTDLNGMGPLDVARHRRHWGCVQLLESVERVYTLYAARNLPREQMRLDSPEGGQGAALPGVMHGQDQEKLSSSPRARDVEGKGEGVQWSGKRRREGPQGGGGRKKQGSPRTPPRAQEGGGEGEQGQRGVAQGEDEEAVNAILDFVVHGLDAELFGRLLQGLGPEA